jgi:hypothetical protein
MKLFFQFLQTTYLNEEVNRTEPSPSVRVPGQSDGLNCYVKPNMSYLNDYKTSSDRGDRGDSEKHASLLRHGVKRFKAHPHEMKHWRE